MLRAGAPVAWTGGEGTLAIRDFQSIMLPLLELSAARLAGV